MAEEVLDRQPMNAHVIETMAEVEDEEHLDEFLSKHTTPFDCSARALLFDRHWRRGDNERFEAERRYQLHVSFDNLLCTRYLCNFKTNKENSDAAGEFMEDMLTIIRRDALDDRPDIWLTHRLELGFKAAARFVVQGKITDAISKIETAVDLLDKTMVITDEVLLPTSCRFLDGMEWRAKEDWMASDNNPDSLKERMIFVFTQMGGMTNCYGVFPSEWLNVLMGKEFDPLRNNPEFEKLCDRVKSLIVTKPKEE